MTTGHFCFVYRNGEWDEYLLAAKVQVQDYAIYSTAAEGNRFMGSLLRLPLGNFRLLVGYGSDRVRAADDPLGGVDYICVPPRAVNRWGPTGGAVSRVDAEKFKRRADLLRYASVNKGALSAHFLTAVRLELGRGIATRTKHLRDVPVAEWVSWGAPSLNEVHDLREALTIATVMEAVIWRDLEKAMDLLPMGLIALQRAKGKGGSWEKAQALELPPAAGAEVGPAGLIQLV